MSALTGPRVVLVRQGTIKKVTYPLAANKTAYDGAMSCIDTAAAGSTTPGAAASTTLIPIGWYSCDDHVAAGAGGGFCGVELARERQLQYWDSVTGVGAITVSNLFQEVYIASDHELTTTSSGNSPAGRVWWVGPQGAPGAIGIEPPFAS